MSVGLLEIKHSGLLLLDTLLVGFLIHCVATSEVVLQFVGGFPQEHCTMLGCGTSA